MLNINFLESKNDDLLFSKFPENITTLQWHSYEVRDLENSDVTLIASSPESKASAAS